MIIWRGWGVLTFLLAALSVLPAVSWVKGDNSQLAAGIGLVVAAVANWFLGRYLNVTVPQGRVAKFNAERSAQLQAAVQSGTFSFGPGHAPPTSMVEAQQQAEVLLAHETAQMDSKGRNSLFFIPMQWWSVLIAVLGILLIVTSF